LVRPLNENEKWSERNINNVATHGIDLLAFSQLIAKIAHGYAATQFKITSFSMAKNPIIDSFESKLTPLIKAKFDKDDDDLSCFDYVGSIYGLFEPSTFLHGLGSDRVVLNGKQFLVVYIRLFGNLGSPIYVCVVSHGA